ncbi:MAG: hypothetical protein MRY57_00450 [Candidatus Pacebacteria bacterium]|nr:hypothetical protein [Candidatus Paceibacterota bacterium]
MKKYLKFIPHIAFAAILLFMGAIGKLTGHENAVAMFTEINLFGQGEAFGRYLVGLGQLAAAIGIFFKPTRKLAAVLGIAIMLGAVYFHYVLELGAPVLPIVTAALGLWILGTTGCAGCKRQMCAGKTCEVTEE